ncbi:MAG TPA: hypothetical protein VLA96_03595 [Terriglobales bacterium]|nr:hypothetical protein [Terriglobales bacterium]
MYSGRRFSDRMVRVVAVAALTTTTVLVFALGWSWAYFFRMTEGPSRFEPLPRVVRSSATASPLEVVYRLELPGRGEIFPALVTSKPSDYWPAAVLTVTNTSDRPVVQTVTAEIPGWSRRASVNVVLPPQQTRKLELTPDLLPRAFDNTEIRRAELHVTAAAAGADAPVFSQASPVLIHAAGDLYWGQRFANAQLIARWVTPHDESVLRLVAEARRFAPNGRLGGYNPPADVRMQAKAVFDALRRSGISYVSSIFTFGSYTGEAQRVRLPRETLALSSANCVDVSVAFASAMENIGMKPVIVIIPGHAFTGVKLGPNARDILYLDLTVLPKGSFAAAEQRAQYWLKRSKPEELLMVDVAAARSLGIYPLPTAPTPVTRAAEGE